MSLVSKWDQLNSLQKTVMLFRFNQSLFRWFCTNWANTSRGGPPAAQSGFSNRPASEGEHGEPTFIHFLHPQKWNTWVAAPQQPRASVSSQGVLDWGWRLAASTQAFFLAPASITRAWLAFNQQHRGRDGAPDAKLVTSPRFSTPFGW